MPFDLKMSQVVFQMHLDQVTDCLPSMITIHDDKCVYSWMPEEHDPNLIQLMKTASQQESSSTVPSAESDSPRSASMVCSLLPKV